MNGNHSKNLILSYEEWKQSMQKHRKEAVAQTKKALAKELELELIALYEITDNCKDLSAKEKLYRRLDRITNKLKNSKSDISRKENK